MNSQINGAVAFQFATHSSAGISRAGIAIVWVCFFIVCRQLALSVVSFSLLSFSISFINIYFYSLSRIAPSNGWDGWCEADRSQTFRFCSKITNFHF